MREHGRPATGEDREKWAGARWCAHHICWHGPHYPCPSYDANTLAEIARQDAQVRANLADGTAKKQLLAHGVSAEDADEAVKIFKLLGGDL